jgi:hypothetical protein
MLEISAQNINRLISALKSEKLTLFTTYQLMLFLTFSLSTFNQIPPFTNFTFEDTEFINEFMDLILKGAEISGLAAEELIEKGKEFPTMDLGFKPPSISDILNTRFSAEFTDWQEEVKRTKTCNI